MVNCRKCGSYNPTGSKFCASCGNSLNMNSNNTQQNLFENKTVMKIGLGVFLLLFLKGIYDWILPTFFYVSYYERANPLITFILIVGGFYGLLYFLEKLTNIDESTHNLLCLIGWGLLFIKGILDFVWEIFFTISYNYQDMHNPFMTLILIVGGFIGVYIYMNFLLSS